MPEVVRPARVIWNQLVGLIFFLIAIPAVFKAWQLFRSLEEDSRSGFGLALSIVFATVMIGFGIASFMRARRIASRL